MVLSRHDLEQMDERYLEQLSPEQLREVSKRLLRDVKELHERLQQDSHNSSVPPSQRPAYQSGRDPKADEDEEPPANDESTKASEPASEGDKEPEEPPKSEQNPPSPRATTKQPQRRAGKQKGAPGYGRSQVLPPQAIVEHRATQCGACGAALPADAPFIAQIGFYQADLAMGDSQHPGVQVVCTLHRYGETGCVCGHRTRRQPAHGIADLPADFEAATTLSEWRLVGPLLASLIVCLNFRMRLSRARIQEWLRDWLQLDLSVGLIHQTLQEAGLAAAPVHEQLIEEARKAPLQQVDETPWKEHGQVTWLWVFVSATVVLFVVGKRTRQVLRQVLSDLFSGWLMSDGHVNYRDYPKRLRCLAHLERKAQGLADSLDAEAKAFGETTLLVLAVVFQQVRDGPDRAVYHPLLVLFKTCCQLHRQVPHEKTGALAREFLNDWDAIWKVLEHPELPATNNAAERALRHWVIARLISHGTRTPQGSRVLAILASLIDTCRLRGLSPWTYLASVIAQRRAGQPAPPLPAMA